MRCGERGLWILLQVGFAATDEFERGSVGEVEISVEDSDAIGDDVVGFAVEEVLVWVANLCSELKAVEIAKADQNRAVDDVGDGDLLFVGGVEGGEELAGDVVVGGQEKWRGKVGEGALPDVVGLGPFLCGFQLLGPVSGGVGEVEIGFRGTAPEDVRVWEIVGEDADGVDDVPEEENGDDGRPCLAMLDE